MDERKKLLKVTAVLVVIGLAAVLYVGISSLYPSEAIKSNRILKVNIKSIPLDSYRFFAWNSTPVMIFRPGKRYKEYLISLNAVTNGKNFNKDTFPEFFAYEPVSTYKGCWISDSTKIGWAFGYKGWYDPCHMGFWDFSGRNIPGINAPSDELLPDLKPIDNYRWISSSEVEFWP